MPKSCTPFPALALSLVAAACGGGGASPPAARPPAIVEFRALREDHRLGERALLRVRYDGGPGRIEPGLGPVGADAVFETPPLRVANAFELVVGGGAAEVRRRIEVAAPYRERFREVPMGFAAANHATVATADGAALVIGGDQGLTILGSEVFRFDPATAAFRSFAQLVFGREHHRAVALGDGTVLVVGGQLSLNRADTPSERIDVRTGTVTLSGALVRDRTGHTATRLADGRVLVLGGSSFDPWERSVRASAEVWDPASGAFALLPQTMTRPRVGHTATRLPDGRVLVFGGAGRDAGGAAAELFDPATGTFAALPDPEPGLRTLHAAVALEDGTVWIGGGEDAQGVARADALWFEPATLAFRPAPGLASGRSDAVGERLADGRVLLAGGSVDAAGTPTAAAEVHAAGAAPRAVALARARRFHTVTRLADGRVLVVGGEGPGGALRTVAELFD